MQRMKTTIEIPDPLFRKAKSKAAERGQTLSELVTEALHEKLEVSARKPEVLAVTDETALAYAGLRVGLTRSGRSIPANDAWIAALALQHELPVLSRDRHFDAVAGLERSDW